MTTMNTFEERVAQLAPETLQSRAIETLQVNLGRLCNLACAHCHLDCSPERTELMGQATMDSVIDVAGSLGDVRIDVTGGAPELHPLFRQFIADLRALGRETQVRTNLTALLAPGLEGTMEFLRENQVGLVASMPCYLEENVRAQRGAGVYEQNVEALRRLNALGYGTDDGPPLDLVYNPGGADLPGEQSALEAAYREEFHQQFGIVFRHLFTIANMPIGRFLTQLRRESRDQAYMTMLREAFNPDTLDALMCQRQVCVDWDGRLYDCDFNLALGLSTDHGAPDRIEAFDPEILRRRTIVTGDHCFGCTAGHGSSCGGALA